MNKVEESKLLIQMFAKSRNFENRETKRKRKREKETINFHRRSKQ